MSSRASVTRSRSDVLDESGFTLIEMVMAIAIGAFAFAAIAAMMLGTLRAISIQKARVQGNEVATQAIEDLQRLQYNNLALCSNALPPAPVPSGFTDPATVTCPDPVPANYTFDPCAPSVSATIPSGSYPCPRNNITYNVRRFIGYGDPGHTEKRLAVFVDWSDSAGPHVVSEQSSLRIPTRAASVGAAPPTFSAASSPGQIELNDDDGTNTPFTLTATTTGLSTSDGVIAVFTVLDDTGTPAQKSVSLTTSNGSGWTFDVPDRSLKLAKGRQSVVFTAIRQNDGKVNSRITGPVEVENAALAPPISAATVTPSDVTLTPTGDLAAGQSFTVVVTTQQVSPLGTVKLIMPTLTGVVSLAMLPDQPACTSPMTTCDTTWRVTVDGQSGYRFSPVATSLYVDAAQAPANGSYPFDNGYTASTPTSTTVNFHL